MLFLTSLSLASSPWLTYINADNARGRTDQLRSLGERGSAEECAAACLDKLGSDPTSGCTSYTYYHSDYHKMRPDHTSYHTAMSQIP